MWRADILPYSVIVGLIAAFVIGFTMWSKLAPGSKKPKQTICLLVALYGTGSFLWILVESVYAQRDTGIPVLKYQFHSLASIAGVSLLSAASFWALRIKEREERKRPIQPPQHNAGSRPPLADSSASESSSSLGPRG